MHHRTALRFGPGGFNVILFLWEEIWAIWTHRSHNEENKRLLASVQTSAAHSFHLSSLSPGSTVTHFAFFLFIFLAVFTPQTCMFTHIWHINISMYCPKKCVPFFGEGARFSHSQKNTIKTDVISYKIPAQHRASLAALSAAESITLDGRTSVWFKSSLVSFANI